MNSFDVNARRATFTTNAVGYDARPGYPDVVYDLLTERCGLGAGTRVLEIGPGTGQATEPMLDRGAEVTAIELGAEMADHLRDRLGDRRLDVVTGAFEDVDVAPASFDLVASATAFHWVPRESGMSRAHAALRPGGWLALWWSVFGDPTRDDPWHDAIQPLLREHAPQLIAEPGAGNPSVGAYHYGLDVEARVAAFDDHGGFGPVHHETIAWVGHHDAHEIRGMFASFSPWIALEPSVREPLLDAMRDLATDEFGGVVERPYVTAIYLAQRAEEVRHRGQTPV